VDAGAADNCPVRDNCECLEARAAGAWNARVAADIFAERVGGGDSCGINEVRAVAKPEGGVHVRARVVRSARRWRLVAD